MIEIGTEVVHHGCCVAFKLAGVAIRRAVFAEFLRLVDGSQRKLFWLR